MRQLFMVFQNTARGWASFAVICAFSYPWPYFEPLSLFFRVVWISCMIGLWLACRQCMTTISQARALQFAPTGRVKERVERALKTCCFIPEEKVKVRYCYSNEGVALTMYNLIGIDPLLWQGGDDDPERIKATAVLERYTLPTLTEKRKQRIAQVKAVLTEPAQYFMVKHELGHLYHYYFYKRIVVTGLIGAIASYLGITVALAVLRHSVVGLVSLLVGIIVASCVDILLSYGANPLFKYREEINADLFAVHFSSAEEIRAAADFFEQHQEILRATRDPENILELLPSVIASGHPDGAARAAYLRKYAASKSSG